MNAFAISQSGVNASAAAFTRSAAAVVRATQPVAPAQVGSAAPLSPAGGDFAAALVGQMMAMANYRANVRALTAADQMAKTTIDLIA